MNITFDPAKDTVNVAKHGISLGSSVSLDWGDERHIISLRKANQREFDRYETETD